MRVVNLARRPFENRRPVIRVAIVLWLLAVGVIGLDIVLYGKHLSGSSSTRERLVELRESVDAERDALSELEAEIAQVQVATQNENVSSLNRLIVQRTFPWSVLFEELEDVLPDDVKLVSVSPSAEDFEISPGRDSRARSRATRSRGRSRSSTSLYKGVELAMVGVARTEDDLIELLERMYDHPAFERPLLSSETLAAGTVDFNLTVAFLTSEADGGRDETITASEDGAETITGAAETSADGEVATGDTPGGATPGVDVPGIDTPAGSTQTATAPRVQAPVAGTTERGAAERGSAVTDAARDEPRVRAVSPPRSGTPRSGTPRTRETTRGRDVTDRSSRRERDSGAGNRTRPPAFAVSGTSAQPSETGTDTGESPNAQRSAPPRDRRLPARRPETETTTPTESSPPRSEVTDEPTRPVVPEPPASGSPQIGGAP